MNINNANNAGKVQFIPEYTFPKCIFAFWMLLCDKKNIMCFKMSKMNTCGYI